MRTRTGLAGATFLAFSLGAASADAQLQLRGSDTLEEVTKDAVAASGLGSVITYVGGGSGAGENAMIAGSQHISPMSRQLNGGTADGTKCVATATQLLLGLDGLSISTGNQLHGDSLGGTASAADDCSDSFSAKTLTGITKADGATLCDATDGCNPAGTYAFANFKEIIQMIYGGMNHTTANGSVAFTAGGVACTYQNPPNEAAADVACPAGQVCFPNNKCGDPAVVGKRNPTRVNCLNPVRIALVNNWNNIFSDSGTLNSCRTGNCTKGLRHAFRRDDLSGTTDAFLAIIGLPALADPTRAFLGSPSFVPVQDRRAVANPFCNAGERPMNKGDSDYLDLDPIRRAVDHQNVSGTRTGLEQVAEVVPSFGGNNNDALVNVDRDAVTAGVQPPIPADHASPTQPGILPDPSVAGSLALLLADIGSNGAGGLLASPYAASTKLGLGLVLPITIPANYATEQVAFFADAGGATVLCDILDPPGVGPATAIASVIMDTQHSANALCPNGTNQPCDLPYKVNPTAPGGKNFNCLSDQLNPNPSAIQDRRIFNMHPVDVTGHYVRDNFINPNIPSLSAARQARVVSAYYRLHTSKTTNLNGSTPTLAAGTFCHKPSSTEQLGCLVKANTCSISFAGRESIDDILLGTANNFAIMMEGIRPTTTNVQNLVTGGTPVYGIARTLWVNSIVGFSSPLVTADELSLVNWMSVPANIDPIISARNFTLVPGGANRMKACPAVFP